MPKGHGNRSRRAPTPSVSLASRAIRAENTSGQGVGVLRLHETARRAGRLVPLSMTGNTNLSAETEVELHFLDRLRDEIKFPSVEALKEQIGRDVRKAQKYLRRLGQREVRS